MEQTTEVNNQFDKKEQAFNWYVVRVQNNKEKYVSERIRIEFDTNNLKDFLGEIVIPHEKVISVRNGKKTTRDKITYPGYIFLQTSSLGELKHFLKGITGAAGLVKSQSGEIVPMRENEVNKLFTNIENKKQEEKTKDSKFIVGESITIIDGPFTTFKGIVESTDGDKIKVSVMIFSRKTIVDLLSSQIQNA